MLSLIECAPVPMLLYNEKVIYANAAFKQLFGYDERELNDLYTADLIEEDVREEINHSIQKRLENRMPQKEYQFRMYTRSGQLRWVHLVAKTINYENEYVGFATFMDITDKKRLENEMVLRDQLWTDIFNQHSAIMLLVDPVDGQIVDANPSAAQFYGYSVEQLKQMNINDINILTKSEIMQKMRAAKEHSTNEFIFEHRLANGEVRTVQVFSTLIHSADSNVLFSIIHDITDRILYEKELLHTTAQLEESEKRYRFITENSTDIIAQITPEMTFSYVSSACLPLMGYEPEELIGRNPFVEFSHPEDDGELEHLLKTMKQGEIATATHRGRKKDGCYIWIETTAKTLVEKNGELKGFITVSRDTSQRKQAEEKLREANQILQQISFMDGLTGIANRRTFDEYIYRTWTDGRRLALIMIDIDQFKNFNDTYGHLKGDDCLKRVASALNLTLRRSHDFLARYGGEEFVVVLNESDEVSAMLVAEQLRHNVEALKIPHSTSSVNPSVTISLGVCHASAAQNIEELIEKTDQALYVAKRSGRNQVVMYNETLLQDQAVNKA